MLFLWFSSQILLAPAATPTGPSGLVLMFLVGFLCRCALLGTEPILEVDFNRYLWDGGLTVRGSNPFSVAPAQIASLPYNDVRLELSKAAGPVFDGISYPELKTIYPPVAQAAFALAHWIEPWSLTAWRLVCLAGELATFALLLALLRTLRRPQMLAALYWLNPLVLKETINSAHMEAILLPLVLGTLLAAIRKRPVTATIMLGLAVGTKLWPIMLAPIILRPLLAEPRRLVAAVALLAGMLAALAWPIWSGGLDASSGLVSFADHWTTNSALFPMLERGLAEIAGVGPQRAGRLLRGASALGVLALSLWLSRRPAGDARDPIARAYLVVTALLLLAPAQFPWYVLWALPLAVLHPSIGWHVAAAIMPLYYLSFHFHIHGGFATYGPWIAWAIWLPVWAAFAWELRWTRRDDQDPAR